MGQWRQNPRVKAPVPSTTPAGPAYQNPITAAENGGQDWNTYAHGLANNAQNYSQSNPFTTQANDYNNALLHGATATSNNPFMQALQGDLQGVNMNEANGMLRDFIGGVTPGGNGGQPAGPSFSGVVAGPNGSVGSGGAAFGSSSHSGGQPPDTVGGQNSFFAQHMRDLFDPSRLDPAHDPTMQPYLDSLKRNSNDALNQSLQGVASHAEGTGMYGSGLYQAMDSQARLKSGQALDDSIAQALMGARTEALNNQMGGLGLMNTRDIAAMNDATQRYGIDASSASSGAGYAAQAADAAKSRQLQAIGMMLQGSQFGLGLKNDLAGTLQTGQNNALNSGLGYANLGMAGYNTGINAGQLGLSGLQLGAQTDLQQQQVHNARTNANRSYGLALQNNEQNALDSYLGLLTGIGGMGGNTTQTNTGSGQYDPNTPPSWLSALMAGSGGYNSYGQKTGG